MIYEDSDNQDIYSVDIPEEFDLEIIETFAMWPGHLDASMAVCVRISTPYFEPTYYLMNQLTQRSELRVYNVWRGRLPVWPLEANLFSHDVVTFWST